ncbi:MAG: hypothetical protein M3133_09275 [Actinomycetota bacterium]|nr:hypothetical protein [Actinomycetota bacterium]
MNGWAMGYVAGVGIVAILAVLLAALILLARSIATTAERIARSLQEAHVRTLGLWRLEELNASLDRIIGGATAAREAVEARRGWR